MNPDLLGHLLSLLVSLGAVLFALNEIVALRTAYFRFDLFSVRRRLFLLVARARIDSLHPAYSGLREMINGLLVAADSISGFQLLVAVLAMRLDISGGSERIVRGVQDQLRSIEDSALREELISIHQDLAEAIHRHLKRLVWVSPILWAFFAVRRTRGSRVQRFVSAVEARGVVGPPTKVRQAA